MDVHFLKKMRSVIMANRWTIATNYMGIFAFTSWCTGIIMNTTFG